MKASRDLRWSELKVGVVVIAGLVLLGIGILSLRGGGTLFSSTYKLYVYMDNTQGLKTGSIVRLAGLDVGNVESIGFSQKPGDKKVMATLIVRKDYREMVRGDSTVTLKTMGLLGDKYLDIAVGSPEAPVLPPGSVLQGIRETQIAGVLSGASTSLEGVNVVLGQLKDILGGVTEGNGTVGLMLRDPQLYSQLNQSAANLRQVTEDLKKGRGTVGKLIEQGDLYDNLLQVSQKTNSLVEKLNTGTIAKISSDDKLYSDLKGVTANLNQVSTDARALTDELRTGNIAKLSNDKELYARLERVSQRLDRVTAELEGGRGTAGKLLSDEELYRNMNKFFKDADTLVLDIKENPKRYLKFSVF